MQSVGGKKFETLPLDSTIIKDSQRGLFVKGGYSLTGNLEHVFYRENAELLGV